MKDTSDVSAVSLVGEVGEEMYKTTLAAIAEASASGSDKLTIFLNTEGGSVYQGLAIYDLIKGAPLLTEIVGAGPVMSAGVLILQAATRRLALPSCQIMVHYGEETNTSAEEVRHNGELTKLMKTILADRAKVKRRTLNSWFVRDFYFTAEQALHAGLIDAITSRPFNEKQ